MRKLLVIGNCQARPLNNILLAAAPDLEKTPTIILHLAQGDSPDLHRRALDEADLILAQVTANHFAVPYLASNALRKTHGDKVLVWPNLFFSGQQPYLRYVTHKTAGRLPGPIESLHDLRILRDWLRTRGADPLPQLDAPDYVETVTRASLAEIETREMGCDLRISDVIRAEYRERRLFFTFNHPSNWLLGRLAERILDRIGRPVKIDENAPREYLARYITPSIWMDLDAPGATFMGTAMDLNAPGKALPTEMRSYTGPELRAAFHACYAHLLAVPDLSDFRFTPLY